jgi:ubiquinone/menaquinone biosynthesis C-methylase UbiE
MSALPVGALAPETETVAACPLCGGPKATRQYDVHDAIWGKPGVFGFVRCDGCGLGYLSPRPPRASIGFYYKDLYEGKGLEFEEKLQGGGIAAFLNRYRLADLQSRRPLARGDRHLDVGCGVGGFIVRAAGWTDATFVGVDFDPLAVDSARRRGAGLAIEVFGGTLADQEFAPGSFATASMIHFLEHSYDPLAELALTHRLLAPGGAIVVEVPSFTSLARRLCHTWWLPHLAPQHVTLFSRATLTRALEKSGFRDVRVHDSWAPFVWISCVVLWWHEHLGGRSRWAKNILARLFTLIVMIVLLLPMLAADQILALFLPRLGLGEHIRATAMR